MVPMSRPALPLAARALARAAVRIATWLIALHVVAQPVVALAASGWRPDSHCCCPTPEECHCPDGNGGNHAPSLRPCGNSGEMIAPIGHALVPAPPAPLLIAPRTAVAVPPRVDTEPTEHLIEPETPPF
jgi:hypothetical protein